MLSSVSVRSMKLKFIYSEKATKFCEIFPLLLTRVHTVKSKGKISQNFMAFSEYLNFSKKKGKKIIADFFRNWIVTYETMIPGFRKERLLTFPFAIWDGMTIFEVPAYLRIGVSSGCTCQLQMVTLFYDYRHALQE